MISSESSSGYFSSLPKCLIRHSELLEVAVAVPWPWASLLDYLSIHALKHRCPSAGVFHCLFVFPVISLWCCLSSVIPSLCFIQHLKSLQHHLWSRRWPTCPVVCIILPWEELPHAQTRGRLWQVFQISCWKCMRGTNNQEWRQALQVGCHFLGFKYIYAL